jgi:hypothetical protein
VNWDSSDRSFLAVKAGELADPRRLLLLGDGESSVIAIVPYLSFQSAIRSLKTSTGCLVS